MSSLEELTQEQKVIADLIQKIEINYKKDGEERKTIEYISARITNLKAYWGEFDKRNRKIQEYSKTHSEHPYFAKNYYEKVEECYVRTKKSLEDKLTSKQKETDKASVSVQNTEQSGGSLKHDSNLNTDQTTRLKKQTALLTAIDRIIKAVNQEAEEQHSSAYFQQKIQTLNDYWFNIRKTHEEIMSFATEADEETEYFRNLKYAYVEDAYQSAIIQLHERQNMLDHSQPSTSGDNRQQTHAEPPKIKLPQLTIPTFNGDYVTWRSFYDLFMQLIHENPRLGKAQKMFYLKSNLSGEPKHLLQNLQISDSNYDTAWELLNNRYNNKRLLVSSHLHNLLRQQTITTESAVSIKRLLDTTKENLLAIKNLGLDSTNWDAIIIHIITQKLDKESHKLYEQSLKQPREVPKLDEFYKFLENRFQNLEAINKREYSIISGNRNYSTKGQFEKARIKNYHNTTSEKCPICTGNHPIYNCSKFLSIETRHRLEAARKAKLCLNCLKASHGVNQCQTLKTCRICQKKHNTLLHLGNTFKNSHSEGKVQTPGSAGQSKSSVNSYVSTEDDQRINEIQSNFSEQSGHSVLLATAILKVKLTNGSTEYLRALIDQGSQASFMSEDAVQSLRLPKEKANITVTGLGSSNANTVRSKVQFQIQPRYSSAFETTVTALVLSKLTKLLPSKYTGCQAWDHTQNLLLADPSYNKPGPIDVILGADVYSKIILNGVIKGSLGTPIAQNTELGWILSGCVKNQNTTDKVVCLVSLTDLETQLRKFWELEEINERPKSPNDMICEEIYQKTFQRSTNGRYIVSIPFKDRKDLPLGESKGKAVARLLQLEKKFQQDRIICKQYNDFMNEYLSLGHMEIVKDNTTLLSTTDYYYVPHHSVFKMDGDTKKLRVVFDASSKTSSGVSLNDQMFAGPTLQQGLHKIMLRWRKHKFGYTADIEKMYRQIELNEHHQSYHRILWRSSAHDKIKEYKLKTVTYGTRSAPFLAVRTLQQLAIDDSKKFPKASKIVMNDFYVDDLISGNDTIEEALEAQEQLTKLLQGGGFHLRKWGSNSSSFISKIPVEERKIGNTHFDQENTVKTLGISWNAKEDTLEFNTTLEELNHLPTKRTLLSDASKLYDPLGWVAPIIILAKIMFQELWQEGLSWDEPLPKNLATKWIAYRREMTHINKIKIPRWITYSKSNRRHELHGFCDASEKAYSAVIYLKSITYEEKVSVVLLCAKTKVAPVNRKISLPRLELCGALLLAKLARFVNESLDIHIDQSYAWTDSTIVLAWLRANPAKWKTFVANRVSEIQALMNPNEWNHVKSEDNPADCASRGVMPAQLSTQRLWWEGPKWLSFVNLPDSTHIKVNTILEQRKVMVHAAFTETTIGMEILSRYSNLTKMIRIIAWCQRFTHNCRNKIEKKRHERLLQVCELEDALTTAIKITQYNEFKKDKEQLSNQQKLSKKSKIVSLNPFIDDNDVMRVGGRLQTSELEYNQKHPVLLPYKSALTTLVIDDAHKRTLHGGIRLTLTYCRQSFWIIKGYSSVKQHLRKCVICHRYSARSQEQLMGNLPKPRLTVTRPFTNTGVDYAGPISIRMSKGRGNKSYKGYLSIFICLSTKAMHLEVVSDMTAEAFIAAYKRFVGRRGNISNLYSDNGTNFVLASKIMQISHKELQEKYTKTVFEAVTQSGTRWHFIPPASPHFGGLWEAGVKSVKYHLKRVIGETTLTFEELSTVLAQVEACLNSRPLCPLTNDSDELDPLTPDHFLIGGAPLIAPPMRDSERITITSRWRMTWGFWERWSSRDCNIDRNGQLEMTI